MLPEDRQDRRDNCLNSRGRSSRLNGLHVEFPSRYSLCVCADVLRALHNAVEYYTEAGRLGMAAKNLRVDS